ncbi:MAG TPA: phosphate ABC transporter substrate-binding protein PstS [Candidatus Baltobacteraceae bacterium]|nr:phosphate ABC transporter substrate-binding protein PstS [Candidatus Baltobacteraceae bacterium]
MQKAIISSLAVAAALTFAGCGAGNQGSTGGSSAAPSAASSAGPKSKTFGTSGNVHARLLETGSSLVYPLMNLWVPDYQKSHPGVEITTQSTGSGTGISQAVSGVAQIGASDAYMSDTQLAAGRMLNIPLAISAQQVNYNLPGLNNVHLNLSGPVLAGIYTGKIQNWDDAAIKAINKQYAAKLPHHAIVPIHRSDGSGDTFIFTQYLSFSTPSWKAGPGYGTTVSWPAVSNGIGAHGNPGMVQSCQNAPYSIAYVGVSFLNETNAAHLGYAALANRDGKFVLPTPETISAAASALVPKTPKDERISLIYAPGAKSYPIINYEYAIVNPKQTDANVRKALVDFLTWTIKEGNTGQYLDKVHFLPLPSGVKALSMAQIKQIQ